MTVTEAIKSAELWWNTYGRFAMPDTMKKESERVIPAPILNGVRWDFLDKRSRLRIIKLWYAHVGIQTVVEGRRG